MTSRDFNLYTWVSAHGIRVLTDTVYTNTANSTHPARFYLWTLKERDMAMNWSHFAVLR